MHTHSETVWDRQMKNKELQKSSLVISTTFFSLLNKILLSPVKFTGNVDVIHEALDVKRQVRRVGTHQLLQLLTLLVESYQCPGLGLDIQLVLLRKLFTEVVDQDTIEVLPTKVWIKRRGQNLTVEEEGGLNIWSNGKLSNHRRNISYHCIYVYNSCAWGLEIKKQT